MPGLSRCLRFLDPAFLLGDVGMLNIGSLKLSKNYIVAPLAGISDFPYRRLCHEYGCELAFVEMINARCLGHKSRRTQEMLATDETDRPLGVQLVGCEPAFLERAMDIITKYRFDILDFNAACPERKVTKRGEGASLLKDLKKLHGLLRIIVRRSPVPVTVKIRSGWSDASLNAEDAARACQDAGVSAVFVHGRTKEQGYLGPVNYDIIRKVKAAVSVPVIASGDIFTPALAQRMFDATGCDAVLVARGALGNPWIFAELDAWFSRKETIARPSQAEIEACMRRHLDLSVDFHGEASGVVVFRKFFIWYTWGLPSTRHLREKANHAKRMSEMLAVIGEFGAMPLDLSRRKDHIGRLSVVP
jgi:tRNA-dihydrouridine synthase B